MLWILWEYGVVIGDPDRSQNIQWPIPAIKAILWKVSAILDKIRAAERSIFCSSGTISGLMKMFRSLFQEAVNLRCISLPPLFIPGLFFTGEESTGANSIASANESSGIV